MKATLQIQRLEDCFEWLEVSSKDYTSSQSISWLIDQVGILCNTMAFVNNQMAVAKELLNKARVKAYQDLQLSMKSQEVYFSPMLAKEYVNSKCSDENYAYDLCERASRTVVHTLDALRTCISALKEEVKVSSYQG